MANQLLEMLNAVSKTAEAQRAFEIDPEKFLERWELTDEQRNNLIQAYRQSDRELWERTVSEEWCRLTRRRGEKPGECIWC